jgi:hypothetical protein
VSGIAARVAAIAILASAGCARRDAAVDAGPTASASVAPPPQVDAAPPDAARAGPSHHRALPTRDALLAHPTCANVVRANERAMDAIARRSGMRTDGDATVGGWAWRDDRNDSIATLGPTCLPLADGSAWAVEIDDRTPPRWTLVHYAVGGARQALPSIAADDGPIRPLGPARVVAFDYDGDGAEEIWVEHGRWCGVSASQRLYTFRGGRIAPYAVPGDARIDDVDDIDDDGRPDLLSAAGLEMDPVRCNLSDVVCVHHAFKRALHSLPDGTFSDDDAAARRYAADRCASAGSEPGMVARRDGAIDGDGTTKRIACARLRGMPTSEIVAALRAECPSFVPSRRGCPTTMVRPACFDWMLDLARATPRPILK